MKTKRTQNSAPTSADANESQELLHQVNDFAREKKLPQFKKLTEHLITSGQWQSFIEFATSHTLAELAADKFCPILEDDAPDWAKRARQMVFASLVPRRGKRTASEFYNIGFDCGYTQMAAELVSRELREEYGRSLLEFSKETQNKLKTRAATELPPDMALEFFKGIANGYKLMRAMPERAQGMAERTKINREIVQYWHELVAEGIDNAPDLHDWLCQRGFLANHQDSKAEVRRICRLIGFGKHNEIGETAKQK